MTPKRGRAAVKQHTLDNWRHMMDRAEADCRFYLMHIRDEKGWQEPDITGS